jgi:hypothetical protein
VSPRETLFPVTVNPARDNLPLHEEYESKSPVVPPDTEVWLALDASWKLTVDVGQIAMIRLVEHATYVRSQFPSKTMILEKL